MLSRGRYNFTRLERNDAIRQVTGEILVIESEDVCEAVSHHRRHESGVVSRFSAYPIRFYKMFPFLEDTSLIAKEAEEDLDFCEFRDDLVDCEAQAIFSLRPCADDPEFIQHLAPEEQWTRDDWQGAGTQEHFSLLRDGGEKAVQGGLRHLCQPGISLAAAFVDAFAAVIGLVRKGSMARCPVPQPSNPLALGHIFLTIAGRAFHGQLFLKSFLHESCDIFACCLSLLTQFRFGFL